MNIYPQVHMPSPRVDDYSIATPNKKAIGGLGVNAGLLKGLTDDYPSSPCWVIFPNKPDIDRVHTSRLEEPKTEALRGGRAR